jgi:hypothetical protein
VNLPAYINVAKRRVANGGFPRIVLSETFFPARATRCRFFAWRSICTPLRNAVSHGIEPPAERAASGKPPVAAVRLRVLSRGGRLQSKRPRRYPSREPGGGGDGRHGPALQIAVFAAGDERAASPIMDSGPPVSHAGLTAGTVPLGVGRLAVMPNRPGCLIVSAKQEIPALRLCCHRFGKQVRARILLVDGSLTTPIAGKEPSGGPWLPLTDCGRWIAGT